MFATELPQSEPVIASANYNFIASALLAIIREGETFDFVEIVKGAPRSGRLLSSTPIDASVALPKKLSRFGVAHELEKLLGEARFDPPIPTSSSVLRGWEIRKIVINGTPAALIWAAWVPQPEDFSKQLSRR
jgi:hypothetical protein